MKTILWFLLFLFVLFVGLVYLSVSGSDKTYEKSTVNNIKNPEEVNFHNYDSVLVTASTLYEGNFIKEIMQGANYRDAWATAIKVPVVFLDTLYGGMTIVEEGGGSQTYSLRLRSASGTVYTLRSISKNPDAHIPDVAKTLGLENIVIDGISAQHPYGAVAAAALAEAAGVLHTHPTPVFVPKQKLLGQLNEKYGNMLYLLEYETEGKINWTHYKDVKEIIDTEDLQELKMTIGENLTIDREAFVRARLFDMLIGDWDRHAKQWGWVLQQTEEGYKAIPLPGDRDNAFFKPQGIIPTIISNKNIEPLVRPFEKDIDYLPGLVYPSDVYFLKGTSEEVFTSEARYLQKALTDTKIKAALKKWPKPLYELNGEEIIKKIIQRRENLVKYAIAFKEVIDKRELLTEPLKGSEELELNPELLKCFECGKQLQGQENRK